jgi:hypothetical protein
MAGASHILTTSWSMIESNKKLMPRRGAANTPMRAIEVLRGLPFRASDFEVGRDRALPKACAGARRFVRFDRVAPSERPPNACNGRPPHAEA